MAITPSSDLKLLKCPIELDNKNQLTFDNATQQYNYFNSLNKLEVDGFTYLRQNNVIRYNAHLDTLLEYNYVMYRNENYSNKWFYAFITRMEYVSDTVTNIYIETDYYQTWMFNLTFLNSFVEREHVADDTIGKHTLDEGISTGEYIQNGSVIDVSELNDLFIVVGISDYQNYSQGNVIGSMQNGIFSALQYVAFNTNSAGISALNAYIKSYDAASKASSIYTIFMAPTYLCPSWTASTDSAVIRDNAVVNSKTVTLNKETTLDTYVPKNNKLKCYPYNYLLATNNNGSNAIYKYELFSTSNVTFDLVSCITTGCSIRIKPNGYNSSGELSTTPNNLEGLDLGKYPTCSWISDSYTNWLTQNSVNNAISLGSGAITAGIGALAIAGAPVTAGISATVGAGMVAGGAGMIANTLNEYRKASLIPDQAMGNINNGDVVTACGDNTFSFRHMSVKKEYAQIIDNYFSMFGYKVNKLKVPALNSRTKWNYIKTIDINIIADIPQDDLQKIKEMFNNGITLWHDSAHFLDYSQSNPIVV